MNKNIEKAIEVFAKSGLPSKVKTMLIATAKDGTFNENYAITEDDIGDGLFAVVAESAEHVYRTTFMKKDVLWYCIYATLVAYQENKDIMTEYTANRMLEGATPMEVFLDAVDEMYSENILKEEE